MIKLKILLFFSFFFFNSQCLFEKYKLNNLSKKNNGFIEINDKNYLKFLSGKKNYDFLLFVSNYNDLQCKRCFVFINYLQKIIQLAQKKKKVFIFKCEYDECTNLLKELKLKSYPHLIYYDYTKSKNNNFRTNLQLINGKNFKSINDKLMRRIEDNSFSIFSFIYEHKKIVFSFISLIILIYKFVKFKKHMFFVIRITLCLSIFFLYSGIMFSYIRKKSFLNFVDLKVKSLFFNSIQNQNGIEVLIISFIYFICALSFLLLCINKVAVNRLLNSILTVIAFIILLFTNNLLCTLLKYKSMNYPFCLNL